MQGVGFAATDGRVQYIPLDESRPDAYSIVTQLQMFVDQFGRDPGVRAVAEKIISTNINNAVDVHVRTLTNWVKEHLIYMADPDGAEYFQSPLVMLQRIITEGRAYGDCDDHVMLLGALLVSVGVPVVVQGVKVNGADHYNHVILSAMVNGRPVDIDPIAKGICPPPYQDRLIA
jgi:transglutaminase-like putative cysteine protease